LDPPALVGCWQSDTPIERGLVGVGASKSLVYCVLWRLFTEIIVKVNYVFSDQYCLTFIPRAFYPQFWRTSASKAPVESRLKFSMAALVEITHLYYLEHPPVKLVTMLLLNIHDIDPCVVDVDKLTHLRRFCIDIWTPHGYKVLIRHIQDNFVCDAYEHIFGTLDILDTAPYRGHVHTMRHHHTPYICT
jgi:hypothetical protein